MVICTGTFSKMLMPALRIGYLVASGPVYDWLLERKQMIDLTTSNFVQRALKAYISVGRYEINLNRARRVYRQRRDAMLAALSHYMPEGTHWIVPKGGIFIWLRLPMDLSANELYIIARREGVSFAPGTLFFPGKKDSSSLRLNFSIQPPEIIEEGIRRLGRAIERNTELKSKTGGASLNTKDQISLHQQDL
jgi:GntR family transcriptional regulator/MocR family aminotransferase